MHQSCANQSSLALSLSQFAKNLCMHFLHALFSSYESILVACHKFCWVISICVYNKHGSSPLLHNLCVITPSSSLWMDNTLFLSLIYLSV